MCKAAANDSSHSGRKRDTNTGTVNASVTISSPQPSSLTTWNKSKLCMDPSSFNTNSCERFERACEKNDIAKADQLFFTIVKQDHWAVVVLNLIHKQFNVFDSNIRDSDYVSILLKPCSNLIENFKTLVRGRNPWKHNLDMFERFSPSGYPHQSTTFDCGLFAILYMENLTARGLKPFNTLTRFNLLCQQRPEKSVSLARSPANDGARAGQPLVQARTDGGGRGIIVDRSYTHGERAGVRGAGRAAGGGGEDGDAAEVRRLLAADPGLARCTATFGNLSSPLHLAATKGHHEIAAVLLEKGADANARNVYGQTPLMQSCRSGHWEVVQTLLAFRCNVWKADGLSGRTALHAAAAGGHVRCVRLLLADAAGAGEAPVPDAALRRGPMAAIGAGSTPLNYAASGGEVRCCQVLLSRGADRMAANSNGWLALDVARMWKCNWLEHVLAPKSQLPIPKFPPSPQHSHPRPTHHALARDNPPATPDPIAAHARNDDDDACSVCLERPCNVAADGRCHAMLCSFVTRNFLLLLLRDFRRTDVGRLRLDRRASSVRARAVPQVRDGPVHGDEGVRGAGARRRRPGPALPGSIASFRKAVVAAAAPNEDDHRLSKSSSSSLPCGCGRCQDRHGSPEEEEKSTCRSYGGGRLRPGGRHSSPVLRPVHRPLRHLVLSTDGHGRTIRIPLRWWWWHAVDVHRNSFL
ncbi:hypothetical protein ZWY2020_059632 [Hordeum vulgare]|nr:hypothetical protein ZWY2020_059632 [Hordeum vulgare]